MSSSNSSRDLRNEPVAELVSTAANLDARISLPKLIGYLRENSLYEAFLDEKGRTGIVTLRSLMDVRNIVTTKLPAVMSYIPRLSPANTVGDAASLMFEYRIRSLPIYENGKLTGKIDSGTIIDRLMQTSPKVRADRLMTPDPICIENSNEVSKARRIMMRKKIDQLPVTKAGSLESVITSSSIVFNMIPDSDAKIEGEKPNRRYNVPVESYAEPNVVSNQASDEARDIYRNMSRNRSTYSVITNFDEIQGIVTHRDFMKMIMNAPRDNDSIPMYIVGLPDDPFEGEATREKFTRVAQLIRKALPNLLEARAVIKAGETKAARKRYRVQIFLVTPRERYNYTASGYELPDLFDEISAWSRKLAEKGNDDRRRGRPRAMRRTRADPGSLQ